MARATQALTTGMKIIGGGNAPAFTLEHLTGTSKHKAGSFETIVIPYIELGRDSSCAVRYGDDAATVSRKHAAIERKGNDVVIRNLSSTNPTLVNGRPVNDRYFLNNGDEIQLSMEGPRLRYNVTASGTASMGVTKRINLVMQQAVKPYRTAVIGLVAFMVVLAGVGGFFIFDGIQQQKVLAAQNEELQKEADKFQAEYEEYQKTQQSKMDSITKSNMAAVSKLKQENQSLASLVKNMDGKLDSMKVTVESSGGSGSLAEVYQAVKNNVYFMRVTKFELQYPNGQVENLEFGWTCTGFMLQDGKFVTARHCVQGWRFLNASDPPDMVLLNSLEQAGVKFNVVIECVSPTETFTFSYSDAKLDDSKDQVIDGVDDYGNPITVKLAALDKDDWAYVNVGKKSDLLYDKNLCYDLKAGDKVVVLGFSYGIGGSQNNANVAPLLSESLVAQDGVNADGSISLTNRNFGQGNSGGPVLYKNKDGWNAIGIVSAGTGAEIGFIVPIGEIR